MNKREAVHTVTAAPHRGSMQTMYHDTLGMAPQVRTAQKAQKPENPEGFITSAKTLFLRYHIKTANVLVGDGHSLSHGCEEIAEVDAFWVDADLHRRRA
uniref:Uncharacterized protein n=1 Tax=Romanomermis culicivorax TaxID=13658 RepID=A0A915J843_ROMCU